MREGPLCKDETWTYTSRNLRIAKLRDRQDRRLRGHRDCGETKLKSEIAREIGRYRILSELGRGSAGCVYLAEDPNIGRRVALKIFAPDGLDPDTEAEFRQRFVTEAKAAGRLSHPGIVTIYDAGTDAATGSYFIAMEWVEGRTLHEHLFRNGGRLAAAAAAELVRQVAFALDYAHREGVVHRDVKPANVLVGKDGRIRVMDFGVAKMARQDLTAVGVVLGTPAYMAPEQVRTGKVDGRSDLFSLGTILYECLTGVNPFAADALSEITFKVLNEEPAAARSRDPRIPEALSAVAEKALRKAPEERFQSGAEMARALEAALAVDEPVLAALEDLGDLEDLPPLDSTVFSADSAGSRAPASRRYLAWTAAVLLAAAGLWAFLGFAGRDGSPSAAREESSAETSGGAAAEPAPANPAAEPEASRPAVPETSSPAAPEASPSAAPPAAAGQAMLGVLYVNRLREGRVSLRIDGVQVWSQEVSAKNPLKRLAAGQRHHIALPVEAGARTIEVRITAPSGIDARQSIQGRLEAGKVRELRVALKRRANQIELDWAD